MISADLIKVASFRPISLQPPNAWVGHLPFAAWVMQKVSPQIFVELGTHSANSYFSFCQAVVETGISSKCYAVDTWQGDEHAGQYSDEIFTKVSAHHQEHYSSFSRLLRMTFDDAASYFADESIALLHIDGLHTYEAVRHDFETWLPKLAPGAVVMFHDTNVRERDFGVWKLWGELQSRFPNNLEFMHSNGLGVLQLDNAKKEKKLLWLEPRSPEKQILVDYFAALGSRQMVRYISSDLQTQLANLDSAVAVSEGQVASLKHAAAEMIGNHNLAMAESDTQIASLNQALAERNEQVISLDQAVAERDGQVANLNQVANNLREFHHAVISSTIWKLSSPLRKIAPANLFIKFLARNPDKIFPSLGRLIEAQKSGGWLALKRTLKALPTETSFVDSWLAYQSRYSSVIRTQVNKQIAGMSQKPLISVLIPTYETPPDILRETLDSVIAQLYPEWELCISDDGSTQPHVREILEGYARRNKRIRLCFHNGNTGVAAATNRALSMARGVYSVLLDHDDKLEKQALFRVAESAVKNSPDMIYSDEVLVSSDGKTVIKFVFRPAFSLELLRSHPYIVHMVAFRTALVREIGGLNENLTISQDYDLILCMAEKSRAIVHIPEVLYLWRQQPNSAGHTYQDQVMETSSKILAAHLARSGETATVTNGKSFNFFEVRYPLEAGLRVAIIIPTKNHGELVRQCVESLMRTIHDICYDIVVIDHESTDTASLAYFAELGKHHRLLHYSGPFNFSAINNWAVSQIGDGYSHYLFCNNDIEAIEEGWLNRMLELGQKPDVGIVGAALLYPDRRTYQHAGVCVGMYGIAEHFAKFMDKASADGHKHPGYIGSLITNHEVSAVTGACLLMRKDAFEAVKGYDETLVVGFGDVDLCLRSSGAGFRVMYCPHAELIHHESYTRGKSTGADPHPLDSALFVGRWSSFLKTGDPYYNPNLSINDTCWSTKNPMEFNIQPKNRISLRDAHQNEMNA